MTCGVYAIRSVVSKRVYIGSSKNIKLRWKHHRNELRNGNHSNFKLLAAYRKYGMDGLEFVVLEETSESELRTREVYFIKLYDSFRNGYNCSEQGSGASPETAQRVREANFRRRGTTTNTPRLSEEERQRRVEWGKKSQALHLAPRLKEIGELISKGLRKSLEPTYGKLKERALLVFSAELQTSRRLGQVLEINTSRANYLLKQLAIEGWVVGVPTPSGKRIFFYKLTDKGRSRVDALKNTDKKR